MWKVLLCFLGHRSLLLATALATIYFGATSGQPGSVSGQFFSRISELPEARELQRIAPLPPGQAVRATKDPFLWLNYLLVHFLRLPLLLSLLLISNVLVILFLWELHELMTRLAMPEVAQSAAVLAVLWPAGYELSLGSSYGLSCLLATMATRHAMDDRWTLAGPALGVLALAEPMALGFLPLFVFLFVFTMRHFQWQANVRKGAFFLVPVLAAVLWRYPSLGFLGGLFHNSALANLFSVVGGGNGAWTFSHSYIGQTISIVLFITGSILSMLGHTTLVQKLVPLNALLVVLAFSSYGSIASRLLVAAAALQGIASHTARPVIGGLQALMLLMGLHEVYSLFR